jgi:hypothetical protein
MSLNLQRHLIMRLIRKQQRVNCCSMRLLCYPRWLEAGCSTMYRAKLASSIVFAIVPKRSTDLLIRVMNVDAHGWPGCVVM